MPPIMLLAVFFIDEQVDQSVEQKLAPVTIGSEKCHEFECL